MMAKVKIVLNRYFLRFAEQYTPFLRNANVVQEGLHNLYQHFGDMEAKAKCDRTIEFIKQYLIDSENGEWHWSLRHDGTINLDDDKAGFWKCPYHNSRMCLELIERGA